MGRTRAVRVVAWVAGVLIVITAVGGALYVATLYRAGAPQRGYLALAGGTVLVGPQLMPHENATVLVEDGIIVAVGATDSVDVPAGAVLVDVSGLTLMPGLIDIHVHLGTPELANDRPPGPLQIGATVLEAARFSPGRRRSLLEHGVTTVRSAGDAYDWITEVRRHLADGLLEGPRLQIAGPIFTTSGGHPVTTIFRNDPAQVQQGARLPATPEEAWAVVGELASGPDAVDFIKVVQDRGDSIRPLEPIALDVLRAIVEAAHSHGLAVSAHWGTEQDLEDVLAAGVDGLEHVGRVLGGWPAGSLEAMVDRGVWLAPTLAVVEARLPADVLRMLQQRVSEFHQAGGRVVAGSDAGMPGVAFGAALHRELELLVASGLSPRKALRAATSEAARALGSEAIGAIAPGRAADIVAVAGDPMREIGAARLVTLVLRDGRMVSDRRLHSEKR